MAESLADKVMQRLGTAAELYQRLIIILAPAGAGKTAALQVIRERTSAPLINVNLELSRRMLELAGRQRTLQLPGLLSQVINAHSEAVVLLDNIEMLFDVSLKHDPVRLLQSLSRNKTLVAAWSGLIESGHIVYATPNHPEYRRYSLRDLLVISPETATC